MSGNQNTLNVNICRLVVKVPRVTLWSKRVETQTTLKIHQAINVSIFNRSKRTVNIAQSLEDSNLVSLHKESRKNYLLD